MQSLAEAISRPRQRYEIKSTSLTAKSLSTLVHLRGANRSAHALGAWSLYADDLIDKSPLDQEYHSDSEKNGESSSASQADRVRNKRRKLAEARFGTSAKEGDGAAIEKLEIVLKDKYPTSSEKAPQAQTEDGDPTPFRPTVTVRFEGTHVFAGIRNMVEEGIVDGFKMPGWMTGEDGVNVATVKDGKVLRKAGAWY